MTQTTFDEIHPSESPGHYMVQGARGYVLHIDTTDSEHPVAARWGGIEHPLNMRERLMGVTSPPATFWDFPPPAESTCRMEPWVVGLGASLTVQTIGEDDEFEEYGASAPDVWFVRECRTITNWSQAPGKRPSSPAHGRTTPRTRSSAGNGTKLAA
jgi:hypothetical protein